MVIIENIVLTSISVGRVKPLLYNKSSAMSAVVGLNLYWTTYQLGLFIVKSYEIT